MNPSSFYSAIGKMNGYNNYVGLLTFSNLLSLYKKEEFINYRGYKKIDVLNNNGKVVEKIICDYFNGTKSNRTKKSAKIQKYIKGCNLNAFVEYLDRNKAPSCACMTNISINISDIGIKNEADMLYKQSLIDIKSYKKFTDAKIIESFLQVIIYYRELKEQHTVENLGIYVPTQNIYYSIKTSDIDCYLDGVWNVFLNSNITKCDPSRNDEVKKLKEENEVLKLELVLKNIEIDKLNDIIKKVKEMISI